MRKIQLVILLAILIVSCSSPKKWEAKTGVFVNELVFESNNLNELVNIEIYNNSGDSLSLKEAVLVVNDKVFKLSVKGFLQDKSFGFYKVKCKLKNKHFKILLKINGEVLDEITWRGQKKSEFIGRYPNGNNFYRLKSRSLGKTNNWTSVRISKPKFNIKSGVYKTVQELILKQEYLNIPMYYSLDGSEVTKKSIKYNGPIEVRKNMALKAKYISDDFKSKTKVMSILIGEKTSLPIVSIVLDSLQFWDDIIGLVKKGPGAEKRFPYKGANYWKDTKLNANFQVFNSNKKEIVNELAGIKIHGNYSRVQSLKSLRVKAEKNSFSFAPFSNNEINSFSEITLRGAGQDMGQGHLRDAFAHNYFGSKLHLDVQAASPVVVFVNANYYGLMYFREVYNVAYFSQHYSCGDKINMLKLWGIPMWGAKDDGGYDDVKDLLHKGDAIAAVKHYDFNNWMDYYIVETYSGNKDWFPNNAKFWKSESTGKWRYVLNDLDAGFGRTSEENYKYNAFKFLDEKSPNLEFKVFMKNDGLKQQFLLRYMDVLNTVLDADTIAKHAERHKETIAAEMPRLFKEHTWNRSLKKWNEFEIPKLFAFYEKRTAIIREQLQTKFSLEDPFLVKIQSNKGFRINSIESLGSINAYYFPHQKLKISPDLRGFSHFIVNGEKVGGQTLKISGKSKETINIQIVFK